MSLPAGNKVIAVDNDFDTVMSAQSLPAAAGAAGACIEAMDMVIKGDVKNAFVLVRPPGKETEMVMGGAGARQSVGRKRVKKLRVT